MPKVQRTLEFCAFAKVTTLGMPLFTNIAFFLKPYQVKRKPTLSFCKTIPIIPLTVNILLSNCCQAVRCDILPPTLSFDFNIAKDYHLTGQEQVCFRFTWLVFCLFVCYHEKIARYIKEAVKNFLADFFRQGCTPPLSP